MTFYLQTPSHPSPFSLRLPLLLTLFVSLAASQPSSTDPICNKIEALDTCDDRIFFPEDQRIKIKYANETITNIEYGNNFVDVDIQIDDDAGFKYRFGVCGCDVRSSSRQVIPIDPRRLFIEEGPALAMYHSLAPGNIAFIKVINRRERIFNSTIRDHILNNLAVEAGNPDGTIDFSKVKDQNPVLSIIGTFSVEDYREADIDIPFLVVAEAQEVSPLARAEWMKIIGLLVGRSEEANSRFDEIEKKYKEAKNKAAKAVRRPSVFFNYPRLRDSDLAIGEKYTWTQPVTDEYIVQFVRDANADYRYIDEQPRPGESGSQFNLSTIVRDFTSADYLIQSSWIPANDQRTLETYMNELVTSEEESTNDPEARKEFEKMKAVRCAGVWSHQRRVTSDGGADDFFESAVFMPDVVLLDFVQALHPYLDFGDRQPTYIYRYEETSNRPKRCNFTVLSGTAQEGKAFADKKFVVPNLDRYQIADRLEDKVFPAIRKRIPERFEVFFHHEDRDQDRIVVTVRVEVRENEMDSFNNAANVIFGMQESLGGEVRRLVDGREQNPPNPDDDPANPPKDENGGGGLSGGAIAGIVIAVILAVLIVGFLIYKRRSRPRRPIQAVPMGDQYWTDGPEVGRGGNHDEAGPFA